MVCMLIHAEKDQHTRQCHVLEAMQSHLRMGARRRMLSTDTIAPLKTSAHLMIQTCSNWAGKVALAVYFRS